MNQSDKVKLIAKVLKAQFPDATKYKTIHVACLILEKLEETDKVESNGA